LCCGGVPILSSPAMAAVESWVTSKACQRLLGPIAVTAQARLTNNHLKPTPGFSYILSGRFTVHATSLEDFLLSATVSYLCLCAVSIKRLPAALTSKNSTGNDDIRLDFFRETF
jgi:hypothetical protein